MTVGACDPSHTEDSPNRNRWRRQLSRRPASTALAGCLLVRAGVGERTPGIRRQALPKRIAGSLAIALVCLEVIAPICWSQAALGPGPALLKETWDSYKHDFLTTDGQVLDYDGRGRDDTRSTGHQRTTSEGQAYALLRAVWMGDRREFRILWRWTQHHLQVRDDHLFAWLGTRESGRAWHLDSTSAASDADEDIALALVFAGHRWRDPTYLSAARLVLDGIWVSEVARLKGEYFLTAGDWATSDSLGVVVNPSYFAPYAYRIFAREDPDHPWSGLVATSYKALERCTRSTLGESKSSGLPPNWCVLNRRTGAARPFPVDAGTDYGYDAFRVMWRVGLDRLWYGSRDAGRYLRSSDYLRQQWSKKGWLAAQYRHDGATANGGWEDPTIYGGDIGDFLSTDSAAATSLLHEKLLNSFRRDGDAAYWGDRWSYYQQNWVWFGVAMASGRLQNLARD
jgi:endoglucanase